MLPWTQRQKEVLDYMLTLWENVKVDFEAEKRIKMRILYLGFAVLFSASALPARRRS